MRIQAGVWGHLGCRSWRRVELLHQGCEAERQAYNFRATGWKNLSRPRAGGPQGEASHLLFLEDQPAAWAASAWAQLSILSPPPPFSPLLRPQEPRPFALKLGSLPTPPAVPKPWEVPGVQTTHQ